MKNETWLGAIVLVLIVGGIALYAAYGRAPATSAPATGIHQDTSYYTIDAAWPTTTPLAQVSAAADQNAVAQMQGWATGEASSFVADNHLASITPADAQYQGITSEHKYALAISYEATSSPATLSYIFSEYYDTLGAHPNGTYETFTYDASTGASLSLSDLFTPGTDVAGELSGLARAELPAIVAQMEGTTPDQVDPSMLDEGTTADLNNFSWFYVANGNLVLLFPPYAVGPYSLGTITLPLPLSSIPNLKPTYR